MRALPIAVGAFGLLGALVTSAGRPPEPSHDWQRVHGVCWQIAGRTSEVPAISDEPDGARSRCAPGMIAVDGRMKRAPDDTIERLQDSTCLDWQPKAFPGRCLRFDPSKWTELARTLPSVPMRFCIDRFEYPNRLGAYPVIAITWNEAGALCAEEGKRLCTEDEWTFACEGEEALPYPYGYERDDEACVIDRQNPAFDGGALGRPDAPRFAIELDRLWRGEPSGSRERCISPFGVHDLTGNVDEWTSSTRPSGYRSIMKGGYWGRIRARCRPSTRAHGETFYFYQQGFRCCARSEGPS